MGTAIEKHGLYFDLKEAAPGRTSDTTGHTKFTHNTPPMTVAVLVRSLVGPASVSNYHEGLDGFWTLEWDAKNNLPEYVFSSTT
eukprot:g43609.t1